MKGPVKGLFRAVGYYPVAMRGIRLRGDPYHIAFWNEVNRNTWEPRTFDILSEFIDRESIFVDVGSWIGPTAMFAAKRASRVYCLEPDPFAYECLLRNIRMNRLWNVIPFHFALGSANGPRRMAIFGGQLGNSRTSFLASGESKEQIETACIRWSSWIDLAGIEQVTFLKMDIEGGEFEVLPTMRDYLRSEKPIVHLSLHAPLLSPAEREAGVVEVAEIMKVYGRCYDEDRRPIDTRAVIERSRDTFASFLFME
jgi:FkbM family methyltransferase